MVRTGNAWRIHSHTNLDDSLGRSISVGVAQGFRKAPAIIDDFIRRLEAGEFATVDDARAALQQALEALKSEVEEME